MAWIEEVARVADYLCAMMIATISDAIVAELRETLVQHAETASSEANGPTATTKDAIADAI